MFTIHAQYRTKNGTGVSRRLRKADKLPAVIYGGKQNPFVIELDQNSIMNLQCKSDFYTTILNLIIEDIEIKVKVQAIQRHPFKPKLNHIDFIRII
ncbi:50S ribosomal protein L25 [Candidatus Erwinia haradaeae]|uniref:Large ribosomal subunit protein bL25 n=1 Tax=Candidatus Erwinia haradaeae TaxID=1922217 RepID=A0A451D2R1_9GAMM|nr:50S ribosomal protein L25 [Candidatus Erwinia haradaeae]VFP79925.1 50S ribosomal protein L25 [Candidatus Erwinia haradaeae]